LNEELLCCVTSFVRNGICQQIVAPTLPITT
jgi:hypothetical protein